MATDISRKTRIGLILSGGGARAAYQIGVLKAISELMPRSAANPFSIICGTSAGAINSAALVIYGSRFRDAVGRLLSIWRNFHVHHVFRSDIRGIAKSGAHWLLALVVGGLGRRNPMALLDRSPLRKLLKRYMPCDRLGPALEKGVADAIGITASSYTSGKSVVFCQSASGFQPWERARRYGREAEITDDHLMASSAIPFIFAPEKLDDGYYGDGSMRQTAPISPALHLGSDKVLVVGVTNDTTEKEWEEGAGYPTLAEIGGHILNSIFLDSLDADLERLLRINKTIRLIPSHHLEEGGVSLRPIEVMLINPSQDLQRIAAKYTRELPWTIRFLLRGVGAFGRNGSSIISYLMFERSYCRELISLGYADTMQRREEIMKFMEIG